MFCSHYTLRYVWNILQYAYFHIPASNQQYVQYVLFSSAKYYNFSIIVSQIEHTPTTSGDIWLLASNGKCTDSFTHFMFRTLSHERMTCRHNLKGCCSFDESNLYQSDKYQLSITEITLWWLYNDDTYNYVCIKDISVTNWQSVYSCPIS